MEHASREAVVNGLAQMMGLPVVLEDASQQLMAYSPHYELSDRIRRDTIMSRTTAQEVVEHFRPFELQGREDPFVVPGQPEHDVLPRLCIPLRHHGTTLGFAWVLLPDEQLDDAKMEIALEAREALTQSMLAESRSRAGETDAVLDLVSTDPESRTRGLTDVEGRGMFGRRRSCTVLVCVGPRWDDPAVRAGFWGATWTAAQRDQLRAVTMGEGIAVLAVDAVDGARRDVLDRALSRILRAGRGGADDERGGHGEGLVVGVGSSVSGPGEAHRSYQEARRAARAARSSVGSPIAMWDELGIERVLTQVPHEVLADAVDPRLRRLVEEAPELAETLERYLEHGGAIASVAEALHIHRTTLYHRLARVGEHGFDLGRGQDRLAAHAGLRALRMLAEWPRPR